MTTSIRFTALETFDSAELQSTYVKGLGYTLRPGNRLLGTMLEGWLKEGKVELTENTKALVSASGIVK